MQLMLSSNENNQLLILMEIIKSYYKLYFPNVFRKWGMRKSYAWCRTPWNIYILNSKEFYVKFYPYTWTIHGKQIAGAKGLWKIHRKKFIEKNSVLNILSVYFPYKFKKDCNNSFLPEYLFQHMCTLEF